MENELTVAECLGLLQKQISHLYPFKDVVRVIDGRYYPKNPEGEKERIQNIDWADYGWSIQSEIEQYETAIKYMRLLIDVSRNVVDVSQKVA